MSTITLTPRQTVAFYRTVDKLRDYDATWATAPIGVQRRTMQTLVRLGLLERKGDRGVEQYALTERGRELAKR